MLNVNREDVMAILALMTPYFVALAAVLLAVIAVFILTRNQGKGRRFRTRGLTGIAAAGAVAIVANLVAFGPMASLITLASGTGTVNPESTAAAEVVAEEIADQGIVLLQNDSSLLPLKEEFNLNLFGWASANSVYGGSGSGGLNNLYPLTSLPQGLENAGFSVNTDLLDFYDDYSADRPSMSIERQSWTLPEPPVSEYPEELLNDAKEFSDVAVVVLGRMAGEGHSDMPIDVTTADFEGNSQDYADFDQGQHYLQLSATEQDLVELVTNDFEEVIVVLNSSNPMELGFVNDHPEIKSVLWVPGPGNVGFDALGKILSGEVNPSGRAPDTFVYNMKDAPWWNNQVKSDYENMTHLSTEGMNAGRPTSFSPAFMNYVEGIYVGYKFYETAASEGIIDYDQVVQYPFGHGLSYTSFDQRMGTVEQQGDTIAFDVTVTNTGEAAGMEVVQVYNNPPYTNGGVEKASANLVTFAKTSTLMPGDSEVVAIEFRLEDLASYDSSGSGGYVVEAGDYTISVNADSHTVLDQEVLAIASPITYGEDAPRPSDHIAATNKFQDAVGDVEYLSRADSFANYFEATAPPASLVLEEPYASTYHTNANFDPTTYVDPSVPMPTTGASNGMKLSDMRGADFDDPSWDLLLDQATVPEMEHLIALSGYQTPGVPSIGKVATVDSDGPAAINNNFTGQGSLGMPVAVMIAATFNQQLAEEYGAIMGVMARDLNSAGWYAPAMNIHRTPFGGRNYEYYSEDGVLSGKIAAAAVIGAHSEGVYSYIKHFALYDFNGKMVSVWSDEQGTREIYLKPFEIAVKDGGADAVMISWNYIGNKWAGESSELNQDVLRGEWGFRGFTLTDFFRDNGHGFMTADMALPNGTDAMLSTFAGGPNTPADTSDPSTVKNMRDATKNIAYTVVNSWVYDPQYEGITEPGWKKLAIGLDVALALLLAGGAFLVVRHSRKLDERSALAK